jgi:C-methyltransferase
MSTPNRWILIERFGTASALATALVSGLVGRLDETPRTAAELATELGLEPRLTARILDVLVAEAVADRDGRGYRAGEALGPGRNPDVEDAWGGIGSWMRLGPMLRREQPLDVMDGDPATRARIYRRCTPLLGDLFEEAAAALATDLGPCGRVLDLGCGAGVWGLACLRHDPDARLCGIDFPVVLDAVRDASRKAGLVDRVETVAADLRKDALPGDFDTVLLANVLRLEPPAVARTILERAARSVTPGGRLVVVDAFGDDRRSVAIYALHLALRTARGCIHGPETVRGWVAAAGLSAITTVPIAPGPAHLAAIVATRPPSPRAA